MEKLKVYKTYRQQCINGIKTSVYTQRCIALKRSLAKPLPFIAERTLKGEN